jgi:hypothetical protein
MITIITTTRDNTEWVKCFIEAARANAIDKRIPIIIVDTSSDKEYRKLTSITKKYHDVIVKRGITINERNKHDSWITDWNHSVMYSKTTYTVFCHIDILLLYKQWDRTILDILKTSSLVSGLFTPHPSQFLPEFNGIRISSSFIATTTEILQNSNFETIHRKSKAGKDIYVENGNISLLAKSKGNVVLLDQHPITNSKIGIRGEFFYYNDLPFYYHCAYSSRIKSETTCPIPDEERRAAKLSASSIERIPKFLIKRIRRGLPITKDIFI